MKGRKPLLYFLMFTVSLVLVLALGELLARVFVTLQTLPAPPPVSTIDPYGTNPYIMRARPYIHFHIPGSRYIQARSYYQIDYEINSMGFRGPEILPKSQGVKRLIVIGDSIVEGHGSSFNKTFSYLLGENLQQARWEVVNLGVQGGSPLYYAKNLKRYLSTSPDDRFFEQSYFTMPFIEDEVLLMSGTFLSKWRLYSLLRRGWRSFGHSSLDEIIHQNKEITYSKEEQEVIDAFKKRLLGTSQHAIAPAVLDKPWGMTQPYLDYVVSSFRRRGISVMIANMALIGPNFNDAHSEYTFALDERVSRWAKAEKIPFLSLLPMIYDAIKEHSQSKIMIYDDGHPTAMTHRLIEGALQPWVVKNLIK
jgi:lysophospholipase L1-like esterase